CERTGEVTLPQLLHLQNGDSVLKKIGADDGRLNALLKKKMEDSKFIEELFLVTLGRRPSAEEIATMTKLLWSSQKPTGVITEAASQSRNEAFADLFWALLNSKEFAFNH